MNRRPRLTTTLATTLAAASLLACGKGDDGPQHWSKRATETVTATVGGVAFSIDVPQGMRQKTEDDEVAFDYHLGDRVYTPDITIRVASKPHTLAAYLETESAKDFLRKEEVPGGFVTSAENPYYKGKEDYLVHVEKTAGDKALTCDARVTRWSQGDKVKDNVPKLEAVCLSLTAK